MKKLTLLLSLVFAAGFAAAQDTKPAAPAKPAEKVAPAKAAPAAKTHDVEAEIVSFDAVKNTVTVKGDPENKTFPVDAKAVAAVKGLKAGEKATLICRDNAKGEHQAVAGVKVAKAVAPTTAPAKK